MFNFFRKNQNEEPELTPRQATNRLLAWLAISAEVGAEIEWQFPCGQVVFFGKDSDGVVFAVDSNDKVFYGISMYEAIEATYATAS